MNNVVNLFNRNARKTASIPARDFAITQPSSASLQQEVASGDSQNNGLTFMEIAERNRVNQERLRKERDQANKSVLKSYRIK